MPDDPAPKPVPSTASLTGQIDVICDRFEEAWRDGRQPRIEEFLGTDALDKGPPRLRELLIELVKIDLEYRWRAQDEETTSWKAVA